MMYVSKGFEPAGLKKFVHPSIFFLSINQYKNKNMRVQKAALYKHQVGVAKIFDILKYGRKK